MALLPRLGVIVGLLALSVAGTGSVRDGDDERICEERRVALSADLKARREEGPGVRQQLLERLEALQRQYQETAPVCVGLLHEHAAFLYVMDERYAEVAAWIERYLEGPGRQAGPNSQIMLHIQRGYALRQIGQTSEGAQATFRAASLADQAPAVFGARALTTAGYVARDLGEEESAVEYFESALRLIADSLASDPTLLDQQGAALTSLSILTDQQIQRAGSKTERDSLIALLDQRTTAALAVLSSEGQPAGHRAHVANLSALVAAWRGDLNLARERMRSSRRLARRAGMMMPLALWNTYMTEGRVAELAGDPAAARAAYERARGEAVRTKAPPNEAEALEALGGLDERQGEWAAAAASYRAAIERREIVRDRLGLGDWSASAFALMQAPYRGLARVRLAQGDAEGAFVVLDRTRARYLLDLRRHLDVRSSLRDESRRAVDSLANRLSDVRLAALVAESTAEKASLRQELAALQQRIEELAASSTTLHEGAPVDLPALQRRLAQERRTLISYMIGAENATAFVVRPDTLVAIDLPTSSRRVREHLRTVGAPWNGRPADPAFSLPALHLLYKDLVEPVRPWVATRAVTIVADADLATAPFAAFLTQPADDFPSAPYLLREWTITTELAAALLSSVPSPPSRAPPVDVLAFGRSVFEARSSTWNTGPLPSLPNVGPEISSVTRHGRSIALMEDEATEAAFTERADQARVIHIASHAEARHELPMYSRIALAGSAKDDGTLHLYELLNTPLHADLVVLSGCSTADGGRQEGEGMMGLQYGMRAAGSAATLATLWPVADAATAELMGTFYDGLDSGLGKDEALRQAQLTYLESHDELEASPFFWAAPILSGSPAPVPFQTQIPWGWLAFTVATVGGGLAWHFRKTHTDV